MTNIRERVFDRTSLYSPGNGRDYLKTPEGEIFSINGLYCDAKGNVDRFGTHVRIMDIRWSVVVMRDCVTTRDVDIYKAERRLVFVGDKQDRNVLAHYGYRVERDADGYENVLPQEDK